MTFFEFEAFVGYIKLERVFFWRKALRLLLSMLLIPSRSAFVDVMLNNEREERPLPPALDDFRRIGRWVAVVVPEVDILAEGCVLTFDMRGFEVFVRDEGCFFERHLLSPCLKMPSIGSLAESAAVLLLFPEIIAAWRTGCLSYSILIHCRR